VHPAGAMKSLLVRLVALFLLGSAARAAAQPFVYVGVTSSFDDAGRIQVVNAQTLDTIATIDLPTGQFAKAIALGLNDRRAYVATAPREGSAAGYLVVIDTLTNSILTTVPLGGAAWAVALSKDQQRVFVAHQPALVSAFSTADHTMVGQVQVGSLGSDMVISPDGATLYVGQRDGVSAVAVATLTLSAQFSTGYMAGELGISPSGHELYVANGSASHNFSIISTASGATQTVPFPEQWPTAVLVAPDSTRVYVASGRADPTGSGGPLKIFDTATRTFTGTIQQVVRAQDAALDPATGHAYFFTVTGVHNVGNLYVMDTTTNTLLRSRSTNGTNIQDGAIALGSPAGCAYQVSPAVAQYGPAGGNGTITIPAPAGCSWSVTSPVPWITLTSAASGSGPGTVTFSVAPSSDPRVADLAVAGQTVKVNQSVPHTWIDEPVSGTVNQPFTLRGWAIVRQTTPFCCPESGVDPVEIEASPAGGGAPIRLGLATRQDRPDIKAAFGAAYANAGFLGTVRGLPAGTYTFTAKARSTQTGEFDTRSVTLTVTTNSDPAGVVDAPRDNDEVTQPFLVAGWAADLARTSGTGVDAVNVYAYPEAGGNPIFLGTAQYGAWPRPDVGQYYKDSAMNGSGFLLLANGLPIGRHRIVAFAHSTVSGEFYARSVTVNVIGSSEAIMQIDIAELVRSSDPTCCRVRMIGWAVDRRATSGVGINTIHVWAYPETGGAPLFLFAATPGIERDITTTLFGTQFSRAGFFSTNSDVLASGAYRVVAYAQSSVTGSFDAVRVVRVVIP
jgi:hypothetical protein